MPNQPKLGMYNLQEIGLAKALVRKGHICDVAYYNNTKEYKEKIEFDDGKCFNILWLRGKKILGEGIYPTLENYLRDYDVIQVGGYIGLTSFFLNKKYSEKTVNYQGPYYYKKNKKSRVRAFVMDNTILRLLNRNEMVVCTKSVLATEYVKTKKINDVTTIGVGLDLDNLTKKENEVKSSDFVEKIRDDKGNKKYLLYVGVLEERRDILFLLKVLKEIKAKDDDYRLIIVGKGKKKYVEKCHEFVMKNGLQDYIYYCNEIEQDSIHGVYECCDAFVLPTKYEIYGMVILEAMYYGLPVFTTYNGGSSTVITEENGCILRSDSAIEWADRIRKIISNSDEYVKLSENAKKTILSCFTWDQLAERFLEVYRKRLEKDNVRK
jgi:glycosyltransferase involved in cell wall biosynthesis